MCHHLLRTVTVVLAFVHVCFPLKRNLVSSLPSSSLTAFSRTRRLATLVLYVEITHRV
jgi:hypothetical protein